MSDKISALTEKTDLADDDLFVIADSAVTGNKKVKAKNITKFINGWTKYTFDYSDFQPSAVPSSQLEVGSDIIPAGGLVTGVKVKHNTAFSGGAVSVAEVTCQADYTGSGTFFIGPLDVFTAPTATHGQQFTGINTPTPDTIPNQGAASKFYVTLTVDTIIDDLTQGEFDLWIKVEELPA
jgi:hypothetical protein